MIKQTALSILSTLLLTSLFMSNNTFANTPEFSTTQQKTHGRHVGKRILSGLAHTALLGTSLIYLVSTTLDFTPTEKIALALLGIRGSCASLKGVYQAIAKSEVASCEEPVTLNLWTAADSALLIPSLFLLKDLLTGPDKLPAKLFFCLPAFYTLGTSIQTIYKIAQNHNANSDLQVSEIHTITE